MASKEMTVTGPQKPAELIAPVQTVDAALMERALIAGDLKDLKPAERLQYYRATCQSLGLNPLTKPFEYINLNGKLTLYAKRDCTDQLSAIHKVTRRIIDRQIVEGVYVVTCQASMPNGRIEESIGAVPFVNLNPADRANALMKCETKAKRRATLSLCGLGFVDESEIEGIPSARVVSVDVAHSQQQITAPQDAAQTKTVIPAEQPKTAAPPPTTKSVDPVNTALDDAVDEFKRSNRYRRLEMFGDLKKDIIEFTGGDADYYRILAEFKVAKSDQFQLLSTAIAAYTKLWQFAAKASVRDVSPEPEAAPSAADSFVDDIASGLDARFETTEAQ